MKPRYRIITMLGNKEYESTLRGDLFIQDSYYLFVGKDDLTHYFPIATTIVTEKYD
jgi:hypothetical protein